jgi:hypothetical protein
MDLGFEPITKEQDANPADEGCWWENTAKGDGAICFFDPDKLLEAKQTAYIKSVSICTCTCASYWFHLND